MSLDYGIRIAQEGKDVKTCEDRECVFTSKYSVAKGGMSGTIHLYDTAGTDETAETYADITHNLGFIPVFRIFMLTEGEYMEIPETEWGAGEFIFDAYYEHLNTNTIRVYADLWISGEAPTLDINLSYYISNEKVNL